MDLKKLSEPLNVNQVEFRIQSINKGGFATILVYKDARVDMQRLDDVVGPTNWKREHTRENHNCVVSIWCEDKRQWISKEDTGTESNTEAQKGLASDSFKRACFNWGIGRELYDYPHISIKLNGTGAPASRGDYETEWFLNEKKKDKWGNPKPDSTWNLKLKEWSWFTQFDENGKLNYIAAKDQNGKPRFQWGQYRKN